MIRPAAEFNPSDPQPGIYTGVPFDVYCAARAVNHSRFKTWRANQSMRVFELDEPNPPSMAKRVGTLFHAFTLEPDNFDARVQIGGPINPATGNEYGRDTKKWADFEAANPGKIIVAAEEFAAFQTMRANIERDPAARRLIFEPAYREATIIYDEIVTLADGSQAPVRCKVRPDCLRPGIRTIGDVKSTERPLASMSLQSQVVNFGYHSQQAVYQRAIHAALGERWGFQFCFVQTVPPYECVVRVLDPLMVDRGEQDWLKFLIEYEECVRRGGWSGVDAKWTDEGLMYPADIPLIRAPKWMTERQDRFDVTDDIAF